MVCNAANIDRANCRPISWARHSALICPLGDLPARSIRIAENRIEVGKQIETGSAKSRASRRVLPLPDDVLDLLRGARKQQLAQRLAFGEGYGAHSQDEALQAAAMSFGRLVTQL